MFGARAIKRRRDKEAELKVLSSNTNSFTSNTNSKIKQNQIQIHSHYVEIKNTIKAGGSTATKMWTGWMGDGVDTP